MIDESQQYQILAEGRCGLHSYSTAAIVQLYDLAKLFGVFQSLDEYYYGNPLVRYVSEFGSGNRNLFGKLESWVVVAFMYFFYYNATKHPDVNRNKVVDNLYLLSMLFYAALTNYPGLIGRIHYDLSIIQCVFLASYIGAGNRKITSIEKVAYLLFVFICMYINNDFETSLRSSYYLMF